VFRFHARDLHLVLGTTKEGKPVRFRVKLDGTPPGDDHGSDVDASGAGTVQGHRLYQLIRQKGAVEDRTFEIEFLDPGVPGVLRLRLAKTLGRQEKNMLNRRQFFANSIIAVTGAGFAVWLRSPLRASRMPAPRPTKTP
jgi:hypothetical protein